MSVVSIYSDKLAHVQVIINCQYFVAQSAPEKTYLPAILGAPSLSHRPLLGVNWGFQISLGADIKNPDIKTQRLHLGIQDSKG